MAAKQTKHRDVAKKTPPEPGEQLDLIDVTPKNLKEIKPLAKKYKAAMKRRMVAGDQEKALKMEILNLVKVAKLRRLADGTIKFRCDGMFITITPRDELVKVKEDENSD